MKRIDHVRKTVYIIVGILTIISLVFSIYKKISHAAGDSSSPYLPTTPNENEFISYYFPTDLTTFVNWAKSNTGSTNNAYYLMWYKLDNGTPIITVVKGYSSYLKFYLNANTNNRLNNLTDINLNYPNGVYYRDISSSGCTIYSIFVDGNSYRIGSTSSNNAFVKVDPACVYFYSSNQFKEDNTSSVVFYKSAATSPVNPPSSIGHTKGGVLANYIDSDDLIEQDSSLPSVDITPPSDPSSNSGWFQKILNGLSKINQSIKGGVLTIGDYIGQGFENVINWFTEPFDQEQFSSDLNQIALINDLTSLKTLVENCGIFDWSDVTPAQSLSFTFDVGGAVLPHTSCVIDFSWYTGTVKNICVAVICTFLVLGLLVTIINQLPNIIGGKSGDKGGGSDS